MRLLARVIGEGGLLGSHLSRHFSKEFPRGACRPKCQPSLPWDRPAELRERLAEDARSLLKDARTDADAWTIFWCAGAGVVQTPAAALEAESRTFETFLADLGAALDGTAPAVPGGVVLASSAGAVYGESTGDVLTEESPCRPLSAYGREKLRQEEALKAWSSSRPGVRTLVCRYSTLYGLRYRSVAPPLAPFPESLGLVAGIYGLYHEYLRLLQLGRLPRPQAR
jgi:UDP-glucose 4-epimerase